MYFYTQYRSDQDQRLQIHSLSMRQSYLAHVSLFHPRGSRQNYNERFGAQFE